MPPRPLGAASGGPKRDPRSTASGPRQRELGPARPPPHRRRHPAPPASRASRAASTPRRPKRARRASKSSSADPGSPARRDAVGPRPSSFSANGANPSAHAPVAGIRSQWPAVNPVSTSLTTWRNLSCGGASGRTPMTRSPDLRIRVKTGSGPRVTTVPKQGPRRRRDPVSGAEILERFRHLRRERPERFDGGRESGLGRPGGDKPRLTTGRRGADFQDQHRDDRHSRHLRPAAAGHRREPRVDPRAAAVPRERHRDQRGADPPPRRSATPHPTASDSGSFRYRQRATPSRTRTARDCRTHRRDSRARQKTRATPRTDSRRDAHENTRARTTRRRRPPPAPTAAAANPR